MANITPQTFNLQLPSGAVAPITFTGTEVAATFLNTPKTKTITWDYPDRAVTLNLTPGAIIKPTPPPPPPPTGGGLFIPSFYDPVTYAADWNITIGGDPSVQRILTLDKANGPGTAQDPHYVTGIAQAHAQGHQVLGYIKPSEPGVSPPSSNAAMIAAIDAWYAFYPNIDGIWIDNVVGNGQQAVSNFTYYQSLYNHIKSQGGGGPNIVMMNFGWVGLLEEYLGITDIANVFENNYSDVASNYPLTGSNGLGTANQSLPAFAVNYPASKFSAICGNVPDIASLTNAVSIIKNAHIAWMWCMQTPAANYPETSIPPQSFFTQEAALVG